EAIDRPAFGWSVLGPRVQSEHRFSLRATRVDKPTLLKGSYFRIGNSDFGGHRLRNGTKGGNESQIMAGGMGFRRQAVAFDRLRLDQAFDGSLRTGTNSDFSDRWIDRVREQPTPPQSPKTKALWNSSQPKFQRGAMRVWESDPCVEPLRSKTRCNTP